MLHLHDGADQRIVMGPPAHLPAAAALPATATACHRSAVWQNKASMSYMVRAGSRCTYLQTVPCSMQVAAIRMHACVALEASMSYMVRASAGRQQLPCGTYLLALASLPAWPHH